MILRYFVLFPAFVGIVVHCEAAMEWSLQHLIGAALLMLGLHLLLLNSKRRSFERSPDEGLADDAEEFPKPRPQDLIKPGRAGYHYPRRTNWNIEDEC